MIISGVDPDANGVTGVELLFINEDINCWFVAWLNNKSSNRCWTDGEWIKNKVSLIFRLNCLKFYFFIFNRKFCR